MPQCVVIPYKGKRPDDPAATPGVAHAPRPRSRTSGSSSWRRRAAGTVPSWRRKRRRNSGACCTQKPVSVKKNEGSDQL